MCAQCNPLADATKRDTAISRKRGFTIEACVPACKKQVKLVPRASSILTDGPSYPVRIKPNHLSKALLSRMRKTYTIMAIDIETHDWLPDTDVRMYVGPLSCETTLSQENVAYQRIIQIGWAIGDIRERVEVKRYTIRPNGFAISTKATNVHGITTEHATAHGHSLDQVLAEFMADARKLSASGGQVVAHHLEFDAGTILKELDRCNLNELSRTWEQIARNGFCTLNSELIRCVKIVCGEEIKSETAKHRLKLTDMTKRLTTVDADQARQHHDAGTDAMMAWYVYGAILQSCMHGETPP